MNRDQGTIALYSQDTKSTENQGLLVQQFDINGPLKAVVKVKVRFILSLVYVFNEVHTRT